MQRLVDSDTHIDVLCERSPKSPIRSPPTLAKEEHLLSRATSSRWR